MAEVFLTNNPLLASGVRALGALFEVCEWVCLCVSNCVCLSLIVYLIVCVNKQSSTTLTLMDLNNCQIGPQGAEVCVCCVCMQLHV